MIRLAASTIGLGARDIADFEARRNERLQHGIRGQRDAEALVEPGRVSLTPKQCRSSKSHSALVQRVSAHTLLKAEATPDPFLAYRLSTEETLSTSSSSSYSEDDTISAPVASKIFVENNSVAVEPTAPSQSAHSPPKDDFYYGGFIETPAQQRLENPTRRLSFSLTDPSTPERVELAEAQGLPSGTKLPRSALFYTQNVSSPPERRATSSLTPRVVSRVSIHNTPGIIFSQPARRVVIRRSPRRFRHQTNSFSFDESDRASGASDQNALLFNPSSLIRTDEEGIYEDPTKSSESPSAIIDNFPLVPSRNTELMVREDISPRRSGHEEGLTPGPRSSSLNSLPQSLPVHPFSAVSRHASIERPSPTTTIHDLGHSSTSLTRWTMDSSVHDSVDANASVGDKTGGHSRTLIQSVSRIIGQAQSSISKRASSRNPHYRAASASEITANASSDPLMNDWPPSTPHTPSRSYQVYNDVHPAISQPQTPANLPEARHRSRYHPAYTAPVTRAASRASHLAMATGDGPYRMRGRGHRILIETPSRRAARLGRRASPVGLVSSGFQGLYGGRENGDEEQNWMEGVQTNQTQIRQWGVRNPDRERRRLSRTPETEDWRIRH